MTELWSILHWLYPDVFTPSTAERFEDSFSLKDGRFDSKFVANVTRFLRMVMLRRTKTSPEIGLNIPTKKEIILSVPLTECQLDWYHKILTGIEQSILVGESSPNSGSFIDLTTDEWERPDVGNGKRKSRITTNTLMELRKVSFAILPVDVFSNLSVLHPSVPFSRCDSPGLRTWTTSC